MNYDIIVVGAGFAGATTAERLARKGKQVLIIDKREHLGGNAYDYFEEGILIHRYGPHIFHTNHEKVFNYLSEFTEWYPYRHRVLGHLKDKIVPIPFNFRSIDECFDKEKAEKLKALLISEYGENKKIPIMELLKNEDEDVKELADFIFENVFKYYTMKQWGLEAHEIDAAVTARVPVNTSYDDGYFNDTYQYMPKDGYTRIFEKMLKSENITVMLGTRMSDILRLKDGKIWYKGKEFGGKVVYTGEIDALFDYCLGDLPYRSLDLKLEKHDGTYQQAATENYPCPKEERAYTRITEYKHFMNEFQSDITYIHREFPQAYDKNMNIPYYPIFTPANQELYEKYVKLAEGYEDLYLLGRLAEYKYYNMDAIILKALELAETIE
ncbi:MAG: UDP-galactopyranose mutase [Erysipelotrichaceae bacterium]|nr:UDP-galactopyranose mutase [Erysipelotrichaceae bacterium]